MKITIEINCDNAAFGDGNAWYEVKSILAKASAAFDVGDRESLPDADGTRLRDSNGNTVGGITVTD